MEIPNSRLSYLYQQYIDKKCSAGEMREFFMLVQDPMNREMLEMLAEAHLESIQQPVGLPDIDWEHMYRNIVQHKVPVKPLFTFWRVAAAAIIIVLCAGGYFLIGKRHNLPAGEVAAKAAKNDLPPGGNRAVLTLANGTSIVLDSAANGVLAQQGNARVLKTNQGQLAYNNTNEKPTEVLYNTLATPRGGQYQLVLPDGSKVWLNAASSIRYPTAFSGSTRTVDITGEAYFEIAKDAGKPFTVRLGSPAGAKGEVKVLGTGFNVNAYLDEPVVRTTLLEGSVKVTKDAATATLKPGQQAELEQAGDIRLVPDPDIAQTMAWKNGLFAFNGADIQTIMRQIKRWYNVDIVFEGDIREKFHLEISRNTNVSNVFRILEATGAVHFKIDGEKIVITQ
jgi:transmembrane sensor